MAFISQETKAKLAPAVKTACKKYGVKASLAVRHHSTLVLNIASGPIDFCESYNRVRLTTDGRSLTCLLGDHEVDMRTP